MPVRRRAPRRKRALRKRGKRGGKKSSIPRGITTQQNQYCKVTETVAFQDILPGVQPINSFNLMDFTRARFMATGFRKYKAVKCVWSYEPLYNTFATESGTTGDTVPYIYTAMNRSGDTVEPNNLAAFQAMGAKPIKFIKKHVVSYKPNWVTPGLPVKTLSNASSGGQNEYTLGSRACYDWIDSSPQGSTNNVAGPPAQNRTGQLLPAEPGDFADNVGFSGWTTKMINSACYSVMYNGHTAIFDQFVTVSDAQKIGRLTLTVEWHFKEPIWDSRITQNNNGPTVE